MGVWVFMEGLIWMCVDIFWCVCCLRFCGLNEEMMMVIVNLVVGDKYWEWFVNGKYFFVMGFVIRYVDFDWLGGV